ncbi:hypothetical protein L7F22_045693 [Adiantum nelumboides]|nr:hypothetical protein [Adiantum nelumboides]
MPREIWTLHRRPEVASTIRAVHLENFFRLPPWGTDYMRAHELMSSIQYDGKAMLTDNDGAKVEVLITKDIINEALHFIPRAYDLIPKTKAIDNEKAFLKVKGSTFKYSDLIYTELELPLRLISQHLRVQKPPRYTEPFLHMAVAMALCVAEKRQVRCDFAKYILESLIEALGMIEDLPASSSQASLIQQAKYVPKAVRTTSLAASSKSSKSTRSRKSSSEEERTETDKEQDSQESAHEDLVREKTKEALSRKAEEPVLEPTQGSPKRPRQEEEEEIENIQADPIAPSPINIPPAPPSSPITPFPPASTPQTPLSPLSLETLLSPPAPISPQQQHLFAETSETPAPLPEETQQRMETQGSPQKETAQHMDKVDEEKQLEREQHQPAKVDVPILMVQDEEPSSQEAILESQLTKKKAQNHELIKNEKKMKEQIKYKDARYQKLNASYNTVKNTLTALLQNQEPAVAAPSTLDSAALNTLAALQAELQIEKLQRQLLVFGFMSQTAQHEAKVKQLEEELAKAKAELAVVGSLASKPPISNKQRSMCIFSRHSCQRCLHSKVLKKKNNRGQPQGP